MFYLRSGARNRHCRRTQSALPAASHPSRISFLFSRFAFLVRIRSINAIAPSQRSRLWWPTVPANESSRTRGLCSSRYRWHTSAPALLLCLWKWGLESTWQSAIRFQSLPTKLAWLCMPFQDLRHSFPDGLFDPPRLSYVPTARDVSGLSISVMLGSDHVPGSPFPVAVLAGVWPLHCSIAFVIRCCIFPSCSVSSWLTCAAHPCMERWIVRSCLCTSVCRGRQWAVDCKRRRSYGLHDCCEGSAQLPAVYGRLHLLGRD